MCQTAIVIVLHPLLEPRVQVSITRYRSVAASSNAVSCCPLVRGQPWTTRQPPSKLANMRQLCQLAWLVALPSNACAASHDPECAPPPQPAHCRPLVHLALASRCPTPMLANMR